MVYCRNACGGTDLYVSDLMYLPILFWCWLRIDTIDRCFSHDTVEEIIDALVSIKLISLPGTWQSWIMDFSDKGSPPSQISWWLTLFLYMSTVFSLFLSFAGVSVKGKKIFFFNWEECSVHLLIYGNCEPHAQVTFCWLIMSLWCMLKLLTDLCEPYFLLILSLNSWWTSLNSL